MSNIPVFAEHVSMTKNIAVFFIVVLACLAGCSDTGRRNTSVSGTVTLDGVPVKAGQVDLEITEEGDLPSGSPIVNGSYSLQSTPGRKRVRISAYDPLPVQDGTNDGVSPNAKPPMPKNLVPEKYLAEPIFLEINKSGTYDIKMTSD